MKTNHFPLLLLIIMLISCSEKTSNDNPNPEVSEEEKKKQELQKEFDANFERLVSSKWVIDEFVPTPAFKAAASGTEDTIANTLSQRVQQYKNFNLVGSFVKTGEGKYKIVVSMNVEEDSLELKLLSYQEAIFGYSSPFLILPKNEFIAEIRRIFAAPFAFDDATIDDIGCFNNGLIILEIEKNTLPNNYDDAVLAKKKLIKNNGEEIYFDSEDKLIVEVTEKKYGTLKWKYRKAVGSDNPDSVGAGINSEASDCSKFIYNPIVQKLKGKNKEGKYSVISATKNGQSITEQYTGEAATQAQISFSGSNAYSLSLSILRVSIEKVDDGNGGLKEEKKYNRKDVAFPTGSIKFKNDTTILIGTTGEEQEVTLSFSGENPVLAFNKQNAEITSNNGQYVFTLKENPKEE